jgi:hypothetical protein
LCLEAATKVLALSSSLYLMSVAHFAYQSTNRTVDRGAPMADPAAYAQAQIDEWHARLKAGASARPSPTIAVAQRAGYERLVVECAGCRQSKRIPWELIRRPPETPLASCSGSSARSAGRFGRYPRRRLDKRGRDLRILDWLGEPTADCPRKKSASVSDQSHALRSDLSKVV